MFAYENGAKTLLNARKNAAKRARLAQPNESTRHRTRASATQRCQTRETTKTRSTRERPNTSPHSAMQSHAKIVATTKKAARGRTVELMPQAVEPWPTELRWIAVQVAPSGVFNKAKTGKLTPN